MFLVAGVSGPAGAMRIIPLIAIAAAAAFAIGQRYYARDLARLQAEEF